MDWTPVAVAAIGGAASVAAAVLPAWISVGRKVERVHSEVRTNHGRTAAQHLEMIPVVVEKVKLIPQLAANQEALLALLVDHTAQDDERFRELGEQIRQLRDRLEVTPVA